MTEINDTDGTNDVCFWWRNHVDRRLFTVLPRDPNRSSFHAVVDDFGDLVQVSQ